MARPALLACCLLLAVAGTGSAARFPYRQSGGVIGVRSDSKTVTKHGDDIERIPLLQPTTSGYVDVNATLGSKIFYIYYEASEAKDDASTRPIVLWLQGGPGCSSMFGMTYINGPYFINEDDFTLRRNWGSWNRLYGMLFMEQPLGTGWSIIGQDNIPDNELDVGHDLYAALQAFYTQHTAFRNRPLIVTGESYAGKYVPSAAHYILQAHAMTHGYVDQLKHPRELPPDIPAPVFPLGGLAIGNGWTDAEIQTKVQAEISWSMGLIDLTQRRLVEQMQDEIIDYMHAREWRKARVRADAMMAYIANVSGSAILEDIRRNIGYDGRDSVDVYLNQPHVMRALGIDPSFAWVSCSPEVDRIMGHDVMKSTSNLIIDLVDYSKVLLYQGQFDAECGVAANDAWITPLQWHGHLHWIKAERKLWYVATRVAGYRKQYSNLTQVVIRNAGHMIPHDNPLYGQIMFEQWMEEEVLGRGPYVRNTTRAMEEKFANPDNGDNANPDTYV